MVTIQVSRELAAPLDKVWEIIADVDREPEFWHGTKSIKNTKKIGKIIEREVVISFKNFICKEIVKIDPNKSVKVKIIDGPKKGAKSIMIKDVRKNKTRID